MPPTEETPVIRTPTWRDNKAVLWLVRAGFVLQFFIPAVVSILLIWDSSLPPKTTNRDEIFYKNLFHSVSLLTLILLTVQFSIFTLILRFGKLRFVRRILEWLILINLLHGGAWLHLVLPMTFTRLIPPTLLY